MLFRSWFLEVHVHIQHSEIVSFLFSAKNCFYNAHTEFCNYLFSIFSNSSKKVMKSFQVDTELLIETQKIHLNMETLIITIKLKYLLKILRSNTCGTKYKSNWKNLTKSTANPWFFLPWYICWTSSKFIFTTETTVLWSFTRRKFSWKRSFRTATSEKYGICKSIVTKLRT